MKKLLKRMIICVFLTTVCWTVFLIADRRQLNNGIIRFHVVAHSDSEEDQAIKLHVRDAVLKSMHADIQKIKNIQEARIYLRDNLPKFQQLVDQTLQTLGFEGGSRVSLCKERFDIRHYDTFSLPAGVYDSLRIVIGDGQGKNWWCVSFPTLCLPATTAGFQDTAVSAGFSEPLVQSLAGNDNYKIRFFFLNQIGKIENILFQK